MKYTHHILHLLQSAVYNDCIVAQVFGLLNTVVYSIGCYLLYTDWKATMTQWSLDEHPWSYHVRNDVLNTVFIETRQLNQILFLYKRLQLPLASFFYPPLVLLLCNYRFSRLICWPNILNSENSVKLLDLQYNSQFFMQVKIKHSFYRHFIFVIVQS